MEEVEGDAEERVRRARMKELEAMVLQLERENKSLLNKVTGSAEKFGEEAAAGRGSGAGERRLENAVSTDDLICLDGDLSEVNEDEWLFVSPAKPPTPTQRRVTPSQWLERGCVASASDPAFSLDEVRKDLSFQISSAESLSPSNPRRTAPAGGVTSPLSARRKLSNPTAKRYLNQVRERRNSPPVDLATTPPGERGTPEEEEEEEEEETVPVVRWRKPVMPQSEEPEDDPVPVVRWRKPVIPQSDPHQDDPVPVVRWRKPVVPRDNSPEEPVAMPTVRWRKPVMPQENVEEALPVKPVQQRNIPVKAISTTARSPPEGEEEGVRGHQSNTLPRTRRSLGGGLRPPGGMSRPRNASAERASQRQYVESSLRSRSPSPGLRQPVNLHSRSPSPTLQPSTMATPPTRLSRLHQQSHVTPSHPHTSPGRHGISKSPSGTGVRNLPTPPSSGGHRSGGRGLPPSSSAPSPGQRVAVSQGRQAAGLSPSSGFARPRQQQMGVVTTPPRVGGARQRVQRSPQRGVAQPSPPPSQSRTVRSSPPSQMRAGQPQRRQQEVVSSEADWLEGCY